MNAITPHAQVVLSAGSPRLCRGFRVWQVARLDAPQPQQLHQQQRPWASEDIQAFHTLVPQIMADRKRGVFSWCFVFSCS